MAYEVKDAVTLAIAGIGAVLGIINTWQNLDQKKVKLQVMPKYADHVHDGIISSNKPIGRVGDVRGEWGCIEVVNLSSFSVHISEIGFTYNRKAKSSFRQAIPMPKTIDQKPFARRLEPRQSLSGYFPLKGISLDTDKAYVMTDCGQMTLGTSEALKEIIRRAY